MGPMLVGELGAAIRLVGKEQFARDMNQARVQFSDLGTNGTRALDKVKGALTTAGVAVIGVATAVTSLGVSVFKAGAGFNALGQTSRAALKSILGSAEAANAQMDRLDAFARTSPFSKAVFIQAQQQMLAFGIETQKVIPYLDALQDAVAAAGGSSQQLSEVVAVISKIKSSAKITGVDLLQLGNHGIDAASMIGLALGKTSQDIRSEITAGTLDATAAIDALMEGLKTRYAGAAANVKATWAGVEDRIRAASRDIGAALAEPFISKDGGGRAITWGNQLADILRALEKHAAPFTNWVVGRLNPAFEQFGRLLDQARLTISGWDMGNLDAQLARLSTYGPGIAATGGALFVMGARSIPILGTLFKTVNPLVGALLGITMVSPELRAAGGELVGSLQPLIPVASDVLGLLVKLVGDVLPPMAGVLKLVADSARPVVEVIGAMPTPVLAGVAAFALLRSTLPALLAHVGPLTVGFRGLADQMRLHQHLAAMNGVQVSQLGAAASVAQGKVVALGTAMKTAFISNPVGLILTAAATAAGVWAMANTRAEEKVREHSERVAELRGTLSEATGAVTGATRAALAAKVAEEGYADALREVGINSGIFVDAMLGQADALSAVEDRLAEARIEMARGAIDATKLAQAAEGLGLSVEDVLGWAAGTEDATKRVNEAIADADGQWQTWGSTMGGFRVAAQDATKGIEALSTFLYEQRDALDAAQKEAADYREAMRQNAAAMSEAERNNVRLNDALAVARDVAADATQRLNALRNALDLLRGGTLTTAEAEAKLNEESLDLADALTQVDRSGNLLTDTLVGVSGTIDTTTREGLRLFDTMGGARDGMLQAAQAAYDLSAANGDLEEAQRAAEDAARTWRDQLIQTAMDSGLTEERARALINTYLDMPETVATLVTDNGTISQVDARLIQLGDQLMRTPDRTVVVDEPESPAIMKRLQELGIKVKTLPDGKVEVNASGIEDVEAALQHLIRERVVKVKVTASGDAKSNADGNLYDAGRARVIPFSNGGFPTGIYPGGTPIYKFAEPETQWEAFVSGRKGQEARNRSILEEAGRRLGMRFVRDQGAPQAGTHYETNWTLNYHQHGGGQVHSALDLVRAGRLLKASVR